jgi:hypothetical protein
MARLTVNGRKTCNRKLTNLCIPYSKLGLGCCFDGFLVNSANHDPKINK